MSPKKQHDDIIILDPAEVRMNPAEKKAYIDQGYLPYKHGEDGAIEWSTQTEIYQRKINLERQNNINVYSPKGMHKMFKECRKKYSFLQCLWGAVLFFFSYDD